MDYYCNHCKKNYKSYQSLWKHNKHFHTNVVNAKLTVGSTVINTNIQENEENTNIKKYTCKYCEKEFNTKQSKSRHEKNYCKKKNNNRRWLRSSLPPLLKKKRCFIF